MLHDVTICYSFDSGRRKSDDALDGNVFTKIMLPQLLIKKGSGYLQSLVCRGPACIKFQNTHINTNHA
jgi:hypothetical protein